MVKAEYEFRIPEINTPEVVYREPGRFSRLILIRGNGEVLVQKLDNGLVIFPGGQEKDEDGDPIETVVRECGEEGTLGRSQLRNLRNNDLLFGSIEFQVRWGVNTDTNFLVLDVDGFYDWLQQTKDPEVVSTAWVNLQKLAEGIIDFEGTVPENIKETASKTIKLLPELIKGYQEGKRVFC